MRNDIHTLLTRRELEVLIRLGEGKSTRQIADILNIDYETVRSHKKHIMEKLGLHSTLALARFIYENHPDT